MDGTVEYYGKKYDHDYFYNADNRVAFEQLLRKYFEIASGKQNRKKGSQPWTQNEAEVVRGGYKFRNLTFVKECKLKFLEGGNIVIPKNDEALEGGDEMADGDLAVGGEEADNAAVYEEEQEGPASNDDNRVGSAGNGKRKANSAVLNSEAGSDIDDDENKSRRVGNNSNAVPRAGNVLRTSLILFEQSRSVLVQLDKFIFER